MSFPTFLEDAVREAALRFGRALDYLEWPNGETDAPPNELNALINLQWALSRIDPPFHFYSEGSIAERGRVDLMASNGATSLAIEAKRFGAINERSDSIFADLNRLLSFAPAYYQGENGRKINDWWSQSERWGLVVITSFRGDEVRDAWLAQDRESMLSALNTYKKRADQPRADGTGFVQLWATPSLHRFAAPISLTDRWSDVARGHLLCGALAL